jgi:hypothetical protein
MGLGRGDITEEPCGEQKTMLAHLPSPHTSIYFLNPHHKIKFPFLFLFLPSVFTCDDGHVCSCKRTNDKGF